MKALITAVAYTLSLLFTGCSRPPPTVSAGADGIVQATVANLLQWPALYSGKSVRVTGRWKLGFEWSQFYDPADPQPQAIWVEPYLYSKDEIFRELNEETRSKIKERLVKRDGWDVEITCEGTFEHGRSGYGHMSRSPSQLTITRVTALKIPSSQ